MSVGLVIVSHSVKLAAGVVELAAQMAPAVKIVAAGGTTDGAGETVLGTSLEKIMDALNAAESGEGVLVLTDLGSAVMTAESALEIIGSPATTLLADAPLVEGAVAAAVAAQSGGNLDTVRRAAEEAWQPSLSPDPDPDLEAEADPAAPAVSGVLPKNSSPAGTSGLDADEVTAELELINPMGLHARPAATLAGALGAMDVEIDINGVDGQSVMMLMTLGAGYGATLRVRATGTDAQQAVKLVRSEVESGFGEL
ncbi:PTS-dependent dihydroxyacetone kinase phosphotransferase subunit DhaM [Paeniglutamicibacter antarcticus]|uniref:Phosphocarrier protein HPr n=1 Tax=Arthrobacter terrae TaxID=2935737 RepID=A0A931CPS8_9MICC|nr:dihydroxyacetone kinase phosphoryl donor subunit DhaM [Arthrobacter terrae]MBG0739896.1 PTS-dependent dihydroxyacetone kinase phosphotransferase subunit DhaM [Arthrobacter terrae]